MKSFLILLIFCIIYEHINYGALSKEIHLKSNTSSDNDEDPVPFLNLGDQLPKYDVWISKTQVAGEADILSLFYHAVEDLSRLKEECVLNEALALESWKSVIRSTIAHAAAVEKIKQKITFESEGISRYYTDYQNTFLLFESGPADCYLEGTYTPTDMYSRYASSFKNISKVLKDFVIMRMKMERTFNEKIERMETILKSFDYRTQIIGDVFLKKILSSEAVEDITNSVFDEMISAFPLFDDKDKEPEDPFIQEGDIKDKDYVELEQEGENVEVESNFTENIFFQDTFEKDAEEMMDIASQLGLEALGLGMEKIELVREFLESFILDEIEETEIENISDDDVITIFLKCLRYFRKGFDHKDKEIDFVEENIMFSMAKQKVRVISAFFRKILSKYDKSTETLEFYIEETEKFLYTTVKSLEKILPKSCKNTDSTNIA